jgi:hypothetical protein
MGPSRTTMPTIALSQLLPALILLRSASSSGLRHNKAVVTMLATKFSPKRTHAFNQSNRPTDPKRHTDVMATLKTTGTNRLRIGICTDSPKTTFYTLSERIFCFAQRTAVSNRAMDFSGQCEVLWGAVCRDYFAWSHHAFRYDGRCEPARPECRRPAWDRRSVLAA